MNLNLFSNFIRDKFDDYFDDWGRYPTSEAIPKLNAIKIYLNKRFPGSKKIIDFNKIFFLSPVLEALHLMGLIAKNKYKKILLQF